MKDIVFRNGKIFLTSDKDEIVKFKVDRILSQVPSGFGSVNFSLNDYKSFVLKKLDELKKDYPSHTFTLEECEVDYSNSRELSDIEKKYEKKFSVIIDKEDI